MTDTRRIDPDVLPSPAAGRWWARWRPISALVLWTLVVWIGRMRNVMADEALDAEGRAARLALAVSFVLPALIIGIGVVTDLFGAKAGSVRLDAFRRLAFGLSAWTIGVWLVRGLDIVLDDSYDVGFRLVHSALAVVSFSVGAWVIRSLRAHPLIEPADV